MELTTIAEVRNWLTFLLVVLGASITLRTYTNNQGQRRFENSLKLIEMFRRVISENDVDRWKSIFDASSEPAGAPPGRFAMYPEGAGDHVHIGFDALFAEGPPDNGAVERMAEVIELICEQALRGTIDLRIIYFEIGQFMDTIHAWLSTIESEHYKPSFLSVLYPNYFALYESDRIDRNWACRTYAHCG